MRVFYHIAGWILLYLLPPIVLQTEIKLPSNFGDYMFWIIVIACFYVNYLWLIPKYLTKGRLAIYFVFIFIMLVFTYSSIEMYVRHVHRMEDISHNEHGNRTEVQKKKKPRYKGYNAGLFCFAVLALGTSIKVTENWYENEKQKKDMENQKLGAELSLLKSQINPHFFFNTLNSIYSLAIIKSDKTPEALIKLSEIMRYIIYDTERTQVPLSKELEYISNYVELQRLRLTKDIKVLIETDLSQEEILIEPMLLLPFIENAFKHGIDIEKGGQILISIKLRHQKLHLHVENPLIEEQGKIDNGSSGVGLNNTLKRLKLLYGNNYNLAAGAVGSNYVVDLILKIREDEVSDS